MKLNHCIKRSDLYLKQETFQRFLFVRQRFCFELISQFDIDMIFSQ